MASGMKSLAQRPRLACGILFLVICLTGVLGRFTRINRIDNRLEDNVLPGEALSAYYRFLQIFGNDRILLAGFQVEKIDNELVRAIFAAEEELLRNPNVQAVWSPISPLRGQMGLTKLDQLETFLKEERQLSRYIENMRQTKSLENLVISPDWKAAGIVIRLDKETGDLVGKTITEVKAILKKHLKRPFHLTGVPEITRLILEMTQRDQKLFSPLSLLFITTILVFLYRTWFGVLIPLLSIVSAMIWTKGIMVAAGFSTNFITSILPPMIISIALTYCIHTLTEYMVLAGSDEEFRAGTLIEAMKRVAKPVALSALTTIVGFGSLLYNSVQAIAEFGFFSCLGIFLAALLALIVVPAGVIVFRQRGKAGELNDFLEIRIEKLTNIIIRNKAAFWFVICVVLGISVWGISILPVETSLIRYLPDDHLIQEANRFVEKRLSGIVPIEILMESTGRRFPEPELLHRIRKIQERVCELPLVDKTLSFVDLAQDFDRMFSSEPHHIPATEEEVRDYLSFYGPPIDEEAEEEEYVASDPAPFPSGGMLGEFISSTSRIIHISLRLRDSSSKELVFEFRKIREIVKQELSGFPVESHLTGRALMWAEVSEILVWNEAMSFGISLIVISLAIMLYFRSFYLGMAAMIPNVIPLIMTYGIMGLSGVSFNTVTGMIASIAIGLAVDDTIHIFYHYRIELESTDDESVALVKTMIHKGRAVCFTSFVLIGGFSVLTLSGFGPTRYFGIFISLAVLAALVSELIVTPLVLTTFRPMRASAPTESSVTEDEVKE